MLLDKLRLDDLAFRAVKQSELKHMFRRGIDSTSDICPSLCSCCLIKHATCRWFTVTGLAGLAKYYGNHTNRDVEVKVKDDIYRGVGKIKPLIELLRSIFKQYRKEGSISDFKFKRSIPEFCKDFNKILLGSSIDSIENKEACIEDTFKLELIKDSVTTKFKFTPVPNDSDLEYITKDQTWVQQRITFCPGCRSSYLNGDSEPLKLDDDRLPYALYPRSFVQIDAWTVLDVLAVVELMIVSDAPMLSAILPRLRSESSDIWVRSFSQEHKIKEKVRSLFRNLIDSENWFRAGKALINLGFGIRPEFAPVRVQDINTQLELWEEYYHLIDLSEGQICLDTPKLKTAGFIFCMANQCINTNQGSQFFILRA